MTKKTLACVLLIMSMGDVATSMTIKPDGPVASQQQVKKKRRTRRVSRRGMAASKRKELAALPTYIACGCGCCPIDNPLVRCLYRSRGDDLQKIIENDKRAASNQAQCAVVGCAMPVKYVYCD
jgi:hypothetical protein